MTARRYFSEQDARNLIGRRVLARVAIIRRLTPFLLSSGTRLIVTAGSPGTVTQFAYGASRDEFLAGVAWDDPRPSIPRRPSYPIDWYTEDEFRDLLGVPVEKAA